MKRPKLLTNLVGSGKRRHHVAAFITQEGEWNRHEPNTGFARVFIAMLILHVFIIGGIILSDFSATPKQPPRSPGAAALLTKSEAELTSARAQPAPSPATTDGAGLEKYTVGSGDSLPTIVARFGVDRDELIQLNHLDQNGEFSAGTQLLIPSRKVAEPQKITAARTLADPAAQVPADQPAPTAAMTAATDTAPTTESASTGTPSASDSAASAAATSASAPAASAPPASTASDAASASSLSTDANITLAPLPEIPSDTAVAATPEKTPADSPPAASKAPEGKTDSVAKEKTPQRAKPAQKKVVAASAAPKPVPPPSVMEKRPATKPDASPKTQGKTTPAKAAGGTHVLAKGETLYRLAGIYGVSVESLIKTNNIKDAAKLREGAKIVIPAK